MLRQKMRLILLLTMSLTTCSSSKSLPPRPNTYICVLNAEPKVKKCFHMKRDYDSNGKLLPTAVPFYEFVNDLNDLNKNIVIEPADFGELKAYINLLKFKITNK